MSENSNIPTNFLLSIFSGGVGFVFNGNIILTIVLFIIGKTIDILWKIYRENKQNGK